MRSIFVLLILVMIGLNGKGQSVTALPDSVLSQCCLEVTLLNGNVTTVDWVFIQYITRDGTGTKLFVEYAPNFGGIQWETQIRIQDDFDEVLARSKFIMLPFTVGSTDYAINRNWVANIEENTTTGGTWVYGRFGTPAKRKFSAVEDYETLKNLLLACRPRAIVVAENGLYTEGDTVRMGGFLIEPTTIETNTYPFTITDDDTGIRFGLSYTYAPSDTVFYFDRVWAGDLFRQHSWYFGRNKLTHIITNDTSTIQVVTNNRVSPSFNVTTFIGSSTGSSLIVSGNASVFGSSNYIDNVYTNVGTGLNSSSLNLISDSTITGLIMGLFRVPVTGKVFMALKTPRVDDTTAVNGQFLQLKDVISGEVDFATIDLSGYLEIADTNAMLDPYIQGAGTINYIPKFTAGRVLGNSNMTDNNTVISILNSKPFSLGQWATAGRPTGVTGYTGYNTTGNGLEWYQGTRWAYALESTFARGTAGRPLFSDSNGQATDDSGWNWDSTNDFMGIGGTSPAARLHLIGNISAPSWTTNGIAIRLADATYNNTTSSGTVTLQYSNRIGNPTFSSSSATTITDAINMAVGTPIAGSNTTLTRSWSILAGSAWLTRLYTSNNQTFQIFSSGMAGTYYTSTPYYSYMRGSSSAIVAQGQIVSNGGIGHGIIGNSISDNGLTSATITGVRGEVYPDRTNTGGSVAIGVRATGRTSAMQGTFHGVYSDPEMYYAGGGGLTGNVVNAFTGQFPTRNNAGATTVRGYYFAGISAPGGGTNRTITTYNPLAIVQGNLTEITNTWSYIDHNTTIGAATQSAQTLHVAGTARITGSAGTATAVMGRDANGDISNLGLSGLSIISGVLTATGSADGNGIYTGSGTLSQHTTRALIPSTGNLFFSQKFNSNADSAYFNIVNYLGGERAVNFGLTDTSSTGYARGYFESDGAGSMNWRLETNDVNGSTTVRALDGELDFITTAGNISITAPVDQEVRVVGMVRAKQEGYYEINSTSSPQNLSNDYSDNFINQGGTQASFTLVFPASPEDGQILKITYNNAISSLTLDGNGNTIVGTTVTTAVAGTQRVFKFYAGNSVWIRQN